MQHYEWQSDAPAPEEPTAPWRAPDWVVFTVIGVVAAYLLTGVVVAILDTHNRPQVSGLMVPLSFLFEVVMWPLPLILPSLHFQTV